jgi:ABC-type cobalamin/Fe3+-siderophores transport system ATPase subunit
LLQGADLAFAYPGRPPVLTGVSIDVPPGGFCGVLGPNGSGKTTLLRLLSGALRPSAGTVTIDGSDLSGLPRTTLARRMAIVPQETHLAFDFSVLEVVLMGRYPHLGTFQIEGAADFAIARQALAATGTLGLEDRQFATLSGGEKQRVIIAGALAQVSGAARSLLVLDEPTAALDLAYQLELAALLRHLQSTLAITVVVSTHDLNFAASICRTLVLLREGRVIARGPVDDVLTAAAVRELYGVDAEVHRHAATGRLMVIPIGRAEKET